MEHIWSREVLVDGILAFTLTGHVRQEGDGDTHTAMVMGDFGGIKAQVAVRHCPSHDEAVATCFGMLGTLTIQNKFDN